MDHQSILKTNERIILFAKAMRNNKYEYQKMLKMLVHILNENLMLISSLEALLAEWSSCDSMKLSMPG